MVDMQTKRQITLQVNDKGHISNPGGDNMEREKGSLYMSTLRKKRTVINNILRIISLVVHWAIF